MIGFSPKTQRLIGKAWSVGPLGLGILSSLVIAMKLRPLFGIQPYCRLFSFWRWVLHLRPFQNWMARWKPQFGPFLKLVGRAREEEASLLTGHVLSHLLAAGARIPPFSKVVLQFFAKENGTLRLSGTVPAQPSLLCFAHQTQTFLATQKAMDAPITPVGLKVWASLEDKSSLGERKAKLSRHMLEASKTLKAGKFAAILADGRKGMQAESLPVLGIELPFQPGFAILAIQTRVPVVFASAILDRDGLLKVVFSEVAKIGEVASHNEEVASLMRQYAIWLEREYEEHPAAIVYPRCAEFMQLAAGETSPEKALTHS